ncbi:MAG: PIN domain-containing protein [Egibacteraceae bacterium]
MASDPPTIVLDTGALVAVERGSATMRGLIAEAQRTKSVLVTPAAVLARAWRGGARQVLLARFLDTCVRGGRLLTRKSWQAAGVLCGKAGTSDVADAAVVICARSRGARVVVTSDSSDLRRLDTEVVLRTP